jgi:hypothetical protein
MTALNAPLSWPILGSERALRSDLHGFRIDAFLGLAPAEPRLSETKARDGALARPYRQQPATANTEAATATSNRLDVLAGVSEFPDIPADRPWLGRLICLATAAGSAALIAKGIMHLFG